MWKGLENKACLYLCASSWPPSSELSMNAGTLPMSCLWKARLGSRCLGKELEERRGTKLGQLLGRVCGQGWQSHFLLLNELHVCCPVSPSYPRKKVAIQQWAVPGGRTGKRYPGRIHDAPESLSQTFWKDRLEWIWVLGPRTHYGTWYPSGEKLGFYFIYLFIYVCIYLFCLWFLTRSSLSTW